MISLILHVSVCPSPGSASFCWLHCQAASLYVLGKVEFWQSQVTFLELVILKNGQAHFPPASFCKSSGNGSAWFCYSTVLPRECSAWITRPPLTTGSCAL